MTEQPDTRENEEASYADASAFVRLFETNSRVRILDVLLGKHYTALTAAQVADLAGIDESTFHRNKDQLIDSGIVKKDIENGKSKYSLDKKQEISELLLNVHNHLMAENVDFSNNRDFVGPKEKPRLDQEDNPIGEIDDQGRRLGKELGENLPKVGP